MKKKSDKASILNRRDVLKIAGATGAAVVFTQMVTAGPLSAQAIQGIGSQTHTKEATSTKHEWHMVIDLDKCIGCEYCLRTCQAVNDVPEDSMRWNVGFPETTENSLDFYMTRPCLHCQQAPCVKVCPVGATWVREDGIVAMDYSRCIGCRYCEVACPYDVRRFNWKLSTGPNPYVPAWGTPEIPRRPRGVVEKCTFCVQRIDRGLTLGLTPGVDPQATPACVDICPVNARIFGDALDPKSPVSVYMVGHDTFRLREDFGTEPKVHYVRPTQQKKV
jgi:dimethyl sulfoxide reductase iron-sulfur subunit